MRRTQMLQTLFPKNLRAFKVQGVKENTLKTLRDHSRKGKLFWQSASSAPPKEQILEFFLQLTELLIWVTL